MTFIERQLLILKETIETSIITGGVKGKESVIRSSELINLIHDAVKYELIQAGVREEQIFPRLGESKPELKLAGAIKQKDQDICVVPAGILMEETVINWEPMAYLYKMDPFGFHYSENTLAINVRSQMSSLGKNTDTLFERTIAEAVNLHQRYPNIVLGEVYMIPAYAYDDALVKKRRVGFCRRPVDIERYVSFFHEINGRPGGENYKYERCALLIVDFSQPIPRLFHNSAQLKAAGLISNDFNIEYEDLGFHTFAQDILRVYADRYDIANIT